MREQLINEFLEYVGDEVNVYNYADAMLDFIEKKFGFRKILLKLISRNLEELIVISSRGLSERIVSLSTAKLGLGISGKVALGGEPILIEDISKSESMIILSKLFEKENIYSLLSIPIKTKKEVIGVINIYEASSKKFSQKIIDNIVALNRLASYSLFFLLEKRIIEEKLKWIERYNEHLMKEKSFHDSIMESIPVGVIATDVKGYVVLMNRVLETMSLLKREECLGKKWYEVFGFTGEMRKKLETSFRTSSPFFFPNIDLPLKDGSVIPVEMKTDVIKDSLGKTIGVVAICMNIEEKRKIEQETEKIERLVVIGKLSAGIAHEIRNPLTGISGVIQILKERLQDDPEMERVINRVFVEIKRLDSVVERLNRIAFSKKMSFELCSINDLIEDSLFFIRKILQNKQINLIKNYDKSIQPIMIDKDAIYQVLLNIMINAMNFMSKEEKERKLKVETKLYKNSDILQLNVQWYTSTLFLEQLKKKMDLKSYIGIIISDNGVGISPAILPKIFEAFFTTSSNGTGLGLYVSARIIKQHKGMIGVRSEKGKGTVFYVFLPLRGVREYDEI